ncbi:hypothetical protein SSBR45R_51560 [Bradyrhizobium sp. SSBR45R]|nr:hypothetical protein SSBR45R_51560 [Bradyrhizobium sp. SSBR45R]
MTQRGSREAEALLSSRHRHSGLPAPPGRSALCLEFAVTGIGALQGNLAVISSVAWDTFLDEGAHRFGVLVGTRREDHLFSLLIQ